MGQTERETKNKATTTGKTDSELTKVATERSATLVAERLSRELGELGESPWEGERFSLQDLLARGPGREERIGMIRDYWRLWAAIGSYRVAWTDEKRLQDLAERIKKRAASADPTSMLAVEHAAAHARLRETELEVIAAQYELADSARLPVDGPLPLPSDTPLVAAYETKFDILYASHAPPAWAQIMDRSLPLRRKSLESRAEAAQAAEDAFEATLDSFANGDVTLDVVLFRERASVRQRTKFVDEVRDYNSDIARFAMSHARDNFTPELLTSMLLAPRRKGDASFGVTRDDRVSPAGFEEPTGANDSTEDPDEPAGNGVEAEDSSDADAESEEAKDREATRAKTKSSKNGIRRETKKPVSGKPPAARPDASDMALDAPKNGQKSDASGEPTETTVFKNSDATLVDAQERLYSGLVDLSPARKAVELSSNLHWDFDASRDLGRAIDLKESLALAAPSDRRAVVEAYWAARQQIARRRLRARQVEMLLSLYADALESRSTPGGREAMVRLNAAKLAADADLAEVDRALLASQAELTRLLGRSLADPWLYPTTPPHAGGYDPRAEKLPPALAATRATRRLLQSLPLLRHSMAERADAVLAADAGRALAAQKAAGNSAELDALLNAIERQTFESELFLLGISEYNKAIAAYVFSVVREDTSPERLAKALTRETPRETPRQARDE